ncbi:MAG: integrase arm-type DNA-binding domain-containing protein [Actinomycetia bacterium]|nr:integrase arm-type DNA-binding domain-containing protein [Actinomycetes bacterium]
MTDGKLTAAGVKALSKPGMHSDGRTLYLNVTRGGSKSWIQRVAINGRRRDIGLGPYPAVGLAQARRRAADNRAAVADGRDPLAEKRKAAAPTFREAAARTLEAHRPRWRSDHYTRNWMRSLEKYAFARLGDTPVDQLGREDILGVLAPIWGVRIETARKLRQRIRTVLRWAQAHGYVEHNVAGDLIDGALPSMPAVREHFRALPYPDVPEALRVVEASGASLAVRLCFRFVVLTAARGGEARGATWDEVDLDAREWRIPGSRMKGGVGHRQPLSDAALAVLEEARTLRDESDLIFPSPSRPGRPLSDMAMTKLLRDVGLSSRATVHGFRSSFRTWASECTDAPHAVMELCLAYRVGDAAERAYARSDLLEKRRALMQQWADYMSAEDGQVASLVGHRG